MTSYARPDLEASLSDPDRKQRYVRRLFSTIADRYDLVTRALSYGRDAAWKRRLVSLSDARPGTRALDLACGTGDIAFALQGRGCRVVAVDVTVRMIEIARLKATKYVSPITFLVGDMMALPFRDATFDLVTIGYGIRNVPQIPPAIGEIRRVLRPGGIVLSLDFDRPASAPLRWIYLAYLTLVGSVLGWILHRDPDTYRYIPESIKRYPGAASVSRLFEAAGFMECAVVPLLGGLMAINTARRP
ncbi:MAG: bifunctional demethylmenaquinone methyltransferase/2-methoxy-6-polyprenyl-1,4-benzoquinol methylase [Acidobacteria bacterium]|nr:MAG: bifunctional demethylmenaquinone methyltransferase/2-methoxy-6-polyprenyl-1,4-benzoquinol methylase [Acidobacteriota bacterium]